MKRIVNFSGKWCLLTLLWIAGAAHGAWFDTTWQYRIAINVPGGASVNSTVKLDVDFAALLAGLSVSGTFDANSPRIVRPNDALASIQEYTDAIYAGSTDATGNARGELRFLLEDAGPATYYLYFDTTVSGTKAANPQLPINGNFERGATGTQSPAGWVATKADNRYDAQVRPSETPSVTTDGGTPNPKTTDGRPYSGQFSYLMGARSSNDTTQANAVVLTRSIAVPASSPGNLIIRYRPEGWDSFDNGSTQFDALRITVAGSTTTEIVGPGYGNYSTDPFSPNKGDNQFSSTTSGYGRYNYWDLDSRNRHTAGMTLAAESEVWFTRVYDLTPYAGQTVTLRFATRHVSQYKTWFHIDDVEWSIVGAALGIPERRSVKPGAFNGYDTDTAAGAIAGVIRTKIAGQSFDLDVIAVNLAGSAIEDKFAGIVKVELLDASDNSAPADASGCRASWRLIQVVTDGFEFLAADKGRKTVSLLEGNAWRSARLRISYPASGTPTVTGCSNDAFAIRPAAFTSPLATDADWASAGTTRDLVNANAGGGVVHRAGRPFTLRANARNAAGATTSNYIGTPSALVSACASDGCGAVLGALSTSAAAVAGVLNNTAATYSEAGAFNLQLVDDAFASIDAGDSTVAERRIASPTVAVGRFVPDRFEITAVGAPVLRTFNDATCSSRSFTYIGQRFGYAALPKATVAARNADGALTASYRGALWKLTPAALTQLYAPLAPLSPGLDAAGIGVAKLTSNGDGTGSFVANAADLLKYVRDPVTPRAEFTAFITLRLSATDATEAATAGNGSIVTPTPLLFDGGGAGIAFDSGALFRYGRLALGNAYGSDLLDLIVPMETQYWNGQGFITNSADHCSAFDAGGVKLYAHAPAGLAASLDETHVALSGRVASGRIRLTLRKPAPAAQGAVSLCVDLDEAAAGDTACQSAVPQGLTFLQGRWSGANFDRDPWARAGFGRYKGSGRLIYQRENF